MAASRAALVFAYTFKDGGDRDMRLKQHGSMRTSGLAAVVAIMALALMLARDASAEASTGDYSCEKTGLLEHAASVSSFDVACGYEALHSVTGGSDNSAFGAEALYEDIGGGFNTASGAGALYSNIEGSETSHTATPRSTTTPKAPTTSRWATALGKT